MNRTQVTRITKLCSLALLIPILLASIFPASYASSGTAIPMPINTISTSTSVLTPSLLHPATATYYAQLSTDDNGNYTVTSSTSGTAVGCLNTGESPCFGIQLTTEDSSGNVYQWVYFVQNGQDVVGCVTTNTGCSSSNEYTFTQFPADDWFNYVFQINFSNATSVTFLMQGNGNSQSWSPTSSANLNNLVAWEVSIGIGFASGGCAVWQNGVTWYVGGYAPSGASLPNLTTTPTSCTASNGSTYNGGSAYWYSTGNQGTGEASNLNSFSWTSNSATNFGYQLSV